MGRPKNKVETIPVNIRTTPKVTKYLDSLVTEELYGKSRGEVAEQLVRSAILSLIENDMLTKLD